MSVMSTHNRLGTGDRIAIAIGIASLAGTVATVTAEHAGIELPLVLLRWLLAGCLAGVFIPLAYLAYDLAWRPRIKGRKLDPFLAIGIAAIFIGLVSLLTYASRGPAAPGPTAKGAPDIVLIAPQKDHEVVWDPSKNHGILFAPIGEITEGQFNSPVFTLQNLNIDPVQDATMKWQISVSSIESFVKSSPRLANYKIDFSDGRLMISGGAGAPFMYRSIDLKLSEEVAIPYVTHAGNKAFIPTNVFAVAGLYAVALLPNTPGAKVETLFEASLSWNIPMPGAQRFLVRCLIANAKLVGDAAPEIDARVSFAVDRVK
jgi:hypothetical protein